MSHTIEQKRASQGSVAGLHTRNLKQLKESRRGPSKGELASQVSRQSATSALSRGSKQRKSVAGCVSKSANQAGKITRNGRKIKKNLDDISVITAERLSRFNQARGTVAGTKTDEIAAATKD